MELAKICEVMALMADIDTEAAFRHVAIARLAAGEVRARLRPGVDEAEHKERLTYVCAAVANYRYALLEAARERATTVKTGSVSVTSAPGERLAAAKALRDELWGMAADILCDADFLFGQVM